MKPLVYDGDTEISMPIELITEDLTINDIFILYHATAPYRDEVKRDLLQEPGLYLKNKFDRLTLAQDLLYKRMIQDLGRDSADLVVAAVSMNQLLGA
jgi:hypothetical protein